MNNGPGGRGYRTKMKNGPLTPSPGTITEIRDLLLKLLIWPCHMPKRRIVIRLFFKAESPDQMHIVFTKIKDLMEV